jgi:carbon monoxide dehydrogenase subunit G
MRLEGTFSVRAPRDRAFAFLLDPHRLSACIDDPHTVEVQDADRFRGTLKSGVGPIKGTFGWSATVVDRVPGERARIKVHGTGMGSAFDIDATIKLTEVQGVTTAAWLAEVTLSGTIATLGARLMQGTVDKKTNAFFENVRRRLEDG